MNEKTPEYVFKFKAQAWRTDSYYVSSSEPVQEITAIGSTKQEAINEADRALGKLNSSFYWRFWLVSSTDIRLLQDMGGVDD
jgi:hypothetical protein